VIEAVTGLLFLLIFLRYGVFARESAVTVEPRLYALLIRDWLAAAVCVAVFVFDARYFLIPRALVLPTALVALLLGLVGGVGIVSSLIAIVIAFGFFGLQFLMSRGRWIGFGDVVYGVFMGAVLGFPKVIVGLFLAYLAGAVYAVIMMATRKMKLKTEVPFGTFLASATVVTMIFGDSILNWYLGLL
jgi:prepilin signal peptidase PulO-like enzyme (type II secretory pathway)